MGPVDGASATGERTRGAGGLALGIALCSWSLAARLASYGWLAAGLAFLAADLTMDALGLRVGAPGAAERATMITVLLVSSLGAALAGGAAIGLLLSQKSTPGD